MLIAIYYFSTKLLIKKLQKRVEIFKHSVVILIRGLENNYNNLAIS